MTSPWIPAHSLHQIAASGAVQLFNYGDRENKISFVVGKVSMICVSNPTDVTMATQWFWERKKLAISPFVSKPMIRR